MRARPLRDRTLILLATAGVILVLVVAAVVLVRSRDTDPGAAPGGTGPAAARWPSYPADLRPAAPTWAPCPDPAMAGLQCGSVAVPLDYGNPAGARTEVAVARRPAGRPDERIGTLVLNPGGPGAPGTRSITGLSRAMSPEVLDRFDVVAWDPRGTGGSTALACDDAALAYFAQDLGQVRPAPAVEEGARAWGQRCQERNGALLPVMGTVDAAYDVESLRRALGDDKISFTGLSYGSAIGLAYAELFPEHLRALLIDGIVDPSIDARRGTIEQAAAVERALDKFLEWCAGNPDCAVGDDPEGALDRAYTQARQGPLRGTVAGADRPLSPTFVNFAVLRATYDRAQWPALGRALAQASAGDGSGVAQSADAYLGSASFSTFLAVSCLDTAVPQGADFERLVEETARVAPRTGAFLANINRPCTSWPVPTRGAPTTVRAEGAPITEVWGTTGDNATPYPNASHVAEMLAQSRLVTLEADRHTALGANECVTRWQTAYLVRLEVPPNRTHC
jgi:pimeloyl-ACP methyl ester carboxylesterase